MIDTKALREKVLDLAIRGKLVPQDPTDEPASVLLERIREQKKQMVKEGKLKAKDVKDDSIIFVGDDNLHYEKFADGTVKCIEDEIPFELPEGWAWIRLQTVCQKEIKRGKAPKYAEKSGTLVFAQKCNTKNGMINISLAQYLDETNLHKYPLELFTQYGDIIINSTGTGTLGRVGIFEQKDDIEHLPIIPDSHITTVRVFPNIVKKYMYLFLKAYQPLFESSGEGSTNQKELRPDVIKSFIVAIPPFNEQKCIVEKFEATDEIIGQLDAYKDNIKGTISSVKSKILDLAIRGKLVPQDPDDEPASVLLERIRAEKEELIKQGKIKRDKNESVIFKGEDNSYYEKIGAETFCIDDKIPFVLPENWRWERLGNISTIARGGSPRPIDDYLTNSEEGINWIKIGDTEQGGKYISSTHEKIIPAGISKSRFVKSGDFLLTNSMSFGHPYILKTDGCIHDGWLVIGDIENVFDQDYLYYALSSTFMYKSFSELAAGSTVKNLKSDTVRSVLFPVPPFDEQVKIASYVEKLFTVLDSIEKSLS